MRDSVAHRLRVEVDGTVQGVGFRPFVYRLARELELAGWISNKSDGLLIEVEGEAGAVETFLHRLETDAPASARVETLMTAVIPAQGSISFSICTSTGSGQRTLVIPPDLATCLDCRRELADPTDRRFRYPFLTCTQCGPRFSLLTAIPYDRPNTTMAGFGLCSACRTEYEDETDRRFHAEPIACPACGPHVILWDEEGRDVAGGDEALHKAAALIREGFIVAVKGLGGFQLWVDAGTEEAVQRLRSRKRRPDKPFALLFPSVESVRASCVLSPEEETFLRSPQAPIVLVRKRQEADLAEAVSPGNPYIGAMLPATPLHYLLMEDLQRPVVATSGNRSEEPIVIDEREVLIRLKGIADAFLVHNRPIARPVDDSVIRVFPAGPEPKSKPKMNVVLLRRARGFVPQAIRLGENMRQGRTSDPVLAVGGHLKNTVAMLCGDRVVMSQHVGDLSTVEAVLAFRQVVDDLQRLLQVAPQTIACDRHPDYRSSVFARELAAALSVPLVPVQHHHAHVASCMAEHGIDGEVLGIAWDGAGYGLDGQIWGGEFLIASYEGFTRFAHLRPFRLPGGEAAMREPSRTAAALLWDIMGEEMPAHRLPRWKPPHDQQVQLAMLLRTGVASPWTTSMGRLFDGVASLTGLCHSASFEGQAAMAVEFAAERARQSGGDPAAGYSMDLRPGPSTAKGWVVDWRPMVSAIVDDLRVGSSAELIAARFHAGIVEVMLRVAQEAGLERVILTGGCFQNAYLLRLAQHRLAEAGFTVYSHCLAPPNDGGLSLGQAVVAAHHADGPSI
jgi:hydrogenase maturation protein HypF